MCKHLFFLAVLCFFALSFGQSTSNMLWSGTYLGKSGRTISVGYDVKYDISKSTVIRYRMIVDLLLGTKEYKLVEHCNSLPPQIAAVQVDYENAATKEKGMGPMLRIEHLIKNAQGIEEVSVVSYDDKNFEKEFFSFLQKAFDLSDCDAVARDFFGDTLHKIGTYIGYCDTFEVYGYKPSKSKADRGHDNGILLENPSRKTMINMSDYQNALDLRNYFWSYKDLASKVIISGVVVK
jgi:hypothetical protein